jgi:hypothetical protein
MLKKIINKILIAGVSTSVFFIASCNKKIDDFGTMNQNPGATTKPVTPALLTNVLAGLGGYTWDAGGITTISGLYSQYFSETQYTEVSTYTKSNPNWDGTYAGSLYDLQNIINYNSDPETAAVAASGTNGSNANQIAVARILKAYIFSVLTDAYGDLPYFGALKGDNGIVPFDKQADIYADLFKELNEAVGQFDSGLPASGDILFGGDIVMWKKFANSLHALLALHLSKVNPSLGNTEFNAALNSSGGVLAEGENVFLKYPGGNFYNPVYNYYAITQRRDYAVSKTLIDWLVGNTDNRLSVFASSTVGFPYGLSRDDAVAFANGNTTWARLLAGAATSQTANFPIITAGEVFLARAEAAQLGWTNENVATMYATGISESWKYWGVFDATDYANYMSRPSIDLSGGSELQKIATQEWVSSYPNGLRGWIIWRRTGFPSLTPAPGASTQVIPRRFAYGTNEYNLNTENVQAAAAQYNSGGDQDSQYGRMWWDN